MNVFVTADLHLGHNNIRRYCARPFASVEEMDETLIANWNRAIAPQDRVFILGDLSWKRPTAYLARLNGEKILILGNHDKMSRSYSENFSAVHEQLVEEIEGHKTVLSHYRLKTWPEADEGAWHLYGHSHGQARERIDVPSCDVGVDVWGYAPVPRKAIQIKLTARQELSRAGVSPLDEDLRASREENVRVNREENAMILSGLAV